MIHAKNVPKFVSHDTEKGIVANVKLSTNIAWTEDEITPKEITACGRGTSKPTHSTGAEHG